VSDKDQKTEFHPWQGGAKPEEDDAEGHGVAGQPDEIHPPSNPGFHPWQGGAKPEEDDTEGHGVAGEPEGMHPYGSGFHPWQGGAKPDEEDK
jgi:hypothetical protein